MDLPIRHGEGRIVIAPVARRRSARQDGSPRDDLPQVRGRPQRQRGAARGTLRSDGPDLRSDAASGGFRSLDGASGVDLAARARERAGTRTCDFRKRISGGIACNLNRLKIRRALDHGFRQDGSRRSLPERFTSREPRSSRREKRRPCIKEAGVPITPIEKVSGKSRGFSGPDEDAVVSGLQRDSLSPRRRCGRSGSQEAFDPADRLRRREFLSL